MAPERWLGQRADRRSTQRRATTKLSAASATNAARPMIAVPTLAVAAGSNVSVAGATGAAVASRARTAVSVSPVSEPTAKTVDEVPSSIATGSRSSGHVSVPVAQTSRS
jgi:hypothetical protein